MSAKSRNTVAGLIAHGGIELNGSRPFDITVHDERFYDRVLAQGSLGLGESYMDGWWDCDELDEFICRLFAADIYSHVKLDLPSILLILKSRLVNRQRLHTHEVGERHYDIGNDLYEAMLDKRMVYSCGYWPNARDLEAAQEAKLDLICRKLGLEEDQRLLDIGSGWGGLMIFAAERYGVTATGITVSKQQAALAEARKNGLPVETRLEDYASLQGRFDNLVSVGMFEHVGYKNYRKFFEKAAELVAEDGLFLLHTIAGQISVTSADPWIDRYIFPNGMLPSLRQIAAATEGLFVIEDVHNLGADYDPTLMAWHANFEAAWPALSGKYGERFRRMWRFYLLMTAGGFRARQFEVYQIVLSRHGVPGGYKPVR